MNTARHKRKGTLCRLDVDMVIHSLFDCTLFVHLIYGIIQKVIRNQRLNYSHFTRNLENIMTHNNANGTTIQTQDHNEDSLTIVV